jgi:hypothetical protein
LERDLAALWLLENVPRPAGMLAKLIPGPLAEPVPAGGAIPKKFWSVPLNSLTGIAE